MAHSEKEECRKKGFVAAAACNSSSEGKQRSELDSGVFSSAKRSIQQYQTRDTGIEYHTAVSEVSAAHAVARPPCCWQSTRNQRSRRRSIPKTIQRETVFSQHSEAPGGHESVSETLLHFVQESAPLDDGSDSFHEGTASTVKAQSSRQGRIAKTEETGRASPSAGKKSIPNCREGSPGRSEKNVKEHSLTEGHKNEHKAEMVTTAIDPEKLVSGDHHRDPAKREWPPRLWPRRGDPAGRR